MAPRFKKTVSLFRTTLASKMTSSQTTMTLQASPGGNIEYPNWLVIEPNSANAEIVYCPSAPTANVFSGITRGVDPTLDTDAAGTGIAHPANMDVIVAPMHRQWNSAVEVFTGVSGSGSNNFRVGDGTDANMTYYAQNADASKPYFQYNATQNKWLISNDGTTTYDIAAGGSGLTRGLGVTVNAGAIDLDVRTSGGLRNNQGTGSQQADVDPTIVARLDTANTWTAVQTLTADRLQITTDADSANDAVRYSQAVSLASSGALSGTSGEAITAGQGVYLKASDSKLYRTDGTADEKTFSFVGVATTTVAAADLPVSYAPPGRVVTTTGLTVGPYYVTDTAGTLGTTPGTRFAKVAFATSTTTLQVMQPKFLARGSFTVSGTGNTSVTTGFYPASITIIAGMDSASGAGLGQISIGDDGNRCVRSVFGTAAATADTVDGSNAASLRDTSATVYLAGTVSAKTASGFTFNTGTFSNGGGIYTNHTIQWTAESL